MLLIQSPAIGQQVPLLLEDIIKLANTIIEKKNFAFGINIHQYNVSKLYYRILKLDKLQFGDVIIIDLKGYNNG